MCGTTQVPHLGFVPQQHRAEGLGFSRRRRGSGRVEAAAGMMDTYNPGGVPSVVWEAQYVKDEKGGWVWGNHREASKQQRAAMQTMVRKHKHAFAYSLSDLPGYTVPVSVGDFMGKPAYSRPKQYSPAETKVIREKFEELRDAGLIRKVGRDNPFASRPTVAAKRDATTGEWTDHRFCINYVALNRGTATDPYPLPLPEAMFRQFGKARFFSKIDCRAGFHQLVLDQPSQQRSSFWVPTPEGGQELWAYCRLPFGMKNSSAIFQRVMDTVLGDAGLRENAGAFVDDVLVWSDTPEQHVQHVKAVLEAMHGVGLRAHPDKSIFMAEGVEYLGHVVSPLGLQPADARVAAFKQLQQPRTKEELRSQLGMLGFYRCYLPHYSSIADPLRKFLKQAAPSLLQWDEQTVGAYQGLVEGLTTEGLCLRRVDPERRFTLHTDWSTKGLGAVLTQVDDEGREGMVACISRSLNVHEAKYPAWKGELLAVVWAVKHFKPYLAGRDFSVVTDHRPLLWLMTTPELTGQQELGGSCIVWAGWECQDLSPAGNGRGLQGLRSRTFFPLQAIWQQLQGLLGLRLAWVFENTAVDVPWQRSQQALDDLKQLKAALGEPLVVDAAQFGSRAHRLRYYWTNLAPHPVLQQLLQHVQRPSGLLVEPILGPGRFCQPVQWDDSAPFYPCNRVGQPRQALPTLVATVGSHAFRNEGPGCIFDTHSGVWTEPTAEEREIALGYVAGATAAPGVSDLVRHQVTGRCMDANTVMAILALSQAVQPSSAAAMQGGCLAASAAECTAAAGSSGFSVSGSNGQGGSPGFDGNYRDFLGLQASAAVAEQQEERGKDIWEDAAAMQFLQTGSHGSSTSRQDKSRIAHRVRLYVWQQQQLWRRMPDGSLKLVPQLEDRECVIKRIHEQTGHFGVRRTAQMVMSAHWWRTLHTDVARFVGKCSVCDRVRSSFNSLQPELSPLPIEPMFYRWGFDLAGEFPVTARGYKWVLIAVEHFSKHIELIPLRSKTPEETAAAGAEIFCRFGAPAEVVTDGGGEWEGAFDELLASCFIDHRCTSPNHPQANGLSERIVQVLKKSLRKLCETRVSTQWDLLLPWIAFRLQVQQAGQHKG